MTHIQTVSRAARRWRAHSGLPTLLTSTWLAWGAMAGCQDLDRGEASGPWGAGIPGGIDDGVDGSGSGIPGSSGADEMATTSSGGAGDGVDGTESPSFDVAPSETTGQPGCAEGDEGCGCTAVDVLFVIDDSISMAPHQQALALAFPQFADTLVQALPPSVSLHVGVTTTEMGYCCCIGGGCNVGDVGTCEGQPVAAHYVTPDEVDTGKNGAQGRLYEAQGKSYFEIETGGPAEDLDALASWFSNSVQLGDMGSGVEMSSAAAGWALDPANDTTNAGFVRDAGSVLVLFFLQDEPDNTPSAATGELLDKIAAAKADCGGLDCVVGGGFVNTGCLSAGGADYPLGAMLDSLGAPPVVAQLPNANDPQAAADEMNALLADVLAAAVATKCEEIAPAG